MTSPEIAHLIGYWMPIEKASRETGVPAYTIRAWVRDGKIRARRMVADERATRIQHVEMEEVEAYKKTNPGPGRPKKIVDK